MITVPLYYDLDRACLVAGPNDTTPLAETGAGGPPAFTWKRRDTLQLILYGLSRNADDAALQRYLPAAIPFGSIQAGVGVGPDAAPASGTFRLRVTQEVGDVTEDLTFPLGATVREAGETLSAALNALPSVVNRGGLEVGLGAAANVFLLRWVDAGITDTIELAENRLFPVCVARTPVLTLPSGQVQVLKFIQLPLAFTDQFALPQPPALVVASVRVGTGTQNCVQSLTVPRGALGQVAMRFASQATRLLDVGTLTAPAIEAALEAIYNDGGDRFSVSAPRAGYFLVEFIGPLANADQTLLEVELHDQRPIETPVARLPLTGPSLGLILDGRPSLDLVFELQITAPDGTEGTPTQTRVRIINDMIDPEMALTADPDWLQTQDPTNYPPYDPAGATILGYRSYIASLDAGTAFLLTHNLASQNCTIEVRELGGTHRRVPDNEYVATFENDSQVRITFPGPVTAGQYAVVILCAQQQDLAVPGHHHPISDIDGLQEILDTLSAAGNPLDLWPAIPQSKLPAHIDWRNAPPAGSSAGALGPYRFDVVPLDLLPPEVALLGADGTLPLSTLPPGVVVTNPDGTITVTVGTPPNQQTITLFAIGNTQPPTLGLGTVFGASITQIVQAALQAGALPPRGLTPMELPKVDRLFPAPAKLHRGDTDAVPLSLVPALLATTAKGNISGALVRPDSSMAGWLYTVTLGGAESPPTRSRPVGKFRAGQQVATNGRHWYSVATAAATTGGGVVAWPDEYDVPLFTVGVTPQMLVNGARFSASFALQLALLDCPVRGLYLLRVVLGRRTAAAGTPNNLLAITEQVALIEQPIVLTDSLATHAFGVAVNRASDGSLTAKNTIYGQDTAVVLPGGVTADFVVSALLTRFDLEDANANPTGQIRVTMNGAVASVFKPNS